MKDPIERHAEIELELAHKAHETERALASAHWKQAEAFGLMTVRGVGLAAAAGIAAVLGFFSANYDRLVELQGSIQSVNLILAACFSALLLELLAAGAGYWSQTLFADSKWHLAFSMERPFTAATRKSKRRLFFGSVFRWASIVLTVAAIAVLVAGGLTFLSLVR